MEGSNVYHYMCRRSSSSSSSRHSSFGVCVHGMCLGDRRAETKCEGVSRCTLKAPEPGYECSTNAGHTLASCAR